jgi:hypothetical protein
MRVMDSTDPEVDVTSPDEASPSTTAESAPLGVDSPIYAELIEELGDPQR